MAFSLPPQLFINKGRILERQMFASSAKTMNKRRCVWHTNQQEIEYFWAIYIIKIYISLGISLGYVVFETCRYLVQTISPLSISNCFTRKHRFLDKMKPRLFSRGHPGGFLQGWSIHKGAILSLRNLQVSSFWILLIVNEQKMTHKRFCILFSNSHN